MTIEITAVTVPDPDRPGVLRLPALPTGLVVFAHGSRSSSTSPRNQVVADHLGLGGIATLVFDLLLPQECRKRALLFDTWLLGSRLRQATHWVRQHPTLAHLPFGYFGSSTGAAAALLCAIDDPSVRAVVSRGGRVDLIGQRSSLVQTPTLLLVGSEDGWVVSTNQAAALELHGEKCLTVINGVAHEFTEPGAMEIVAEAAQSWFQKYLLS